jgi:hypothetical protein
MAAGGEEGPDGRAAAAAAELYGLPLGEFTAARAERVKQARADGDRDAAAAIGKLPKPSVAAWLANQLARQQPGELEPLLDLGTELREATAALDAGRLRELSRRQRQVVAGLVDRARELAGAAGQAFSDSTARGLEDTLHAALADESAAAQLTGGQLAAGLSRTGFPGIDSTAEAAPAAFAAAPSPPASARRRAADAGTDATARAGKQARAAGTGTQSGAARAEKQAQAAEAAAQARRQQLERAHRAEAQARSDVDAATRDRDAAQAALARAQAAAQQAARDIDRLQDELDAAVAAQTQAGRAQRQARTEADRADRTARQAGRRLAEATARREELEGSR